LRRTRGVELEVALPARAGQIRRPMARVAVRGGLVVVG
jgi:hypothetical protein